MDHRAAVDQRRGLGRPRSQQPAAQHGAPPRPEVHLRGARGERERRRPVVGEARGPRRRDGSAALAAGPDRPERGRPLVHAVLDDARPGGRERPRVRARAHAGMHDRDRRRCLHDVGDRRSRRPDDDHHRHFRRHGVADVPPRRVPVRRQMRRR